MFTNIKKLDFKITKENQDLFVTGIPETGNDVFFKSDNADGFNLFSLACATMPVEEARMRFIVKACVDQVLIRYNKYGNDNELLYAGHVVVPYPYFPAVKNTERNFRILDLKNGTEVNIPGIIEKAFIHVNGGINVEHLNGCINVIADGSEQVELSAVGFSLLIETGFYVKDTETQVN
ncbi:hypothetical protein [Klebsiella pneumoniae]|uniref:hypothetical protein n=1 Tax=Klebsiella pneumoniae TaxID=573 RepID=UPI000D1C1CDF|nr:hypothetical protein [Klebsiella pneumoniae]